MYLNEIEFNDEHQSSYMFENNSFYNEEEEDED